ncbi:hypothetical protein [Priestia megaterium]|uniref:hypothetical protein n=1 Tax=Priestia megaterium TaxID=1404 RepID=UPI0028778CB6|nr:hypothetical protein [Priestia megaterium]
MSRYESSELLLRMIMGLYMTALPAMLLNEMIDSFVEIFSPFFILVLSIIMGISLMSHSSFHLLYKVKIKLFKSS